MAWVRFDSYSLQLCSVGMALHVISLLTGLSSSIVCSFLAPWQTQWWVCHCQSKQDMKSSWSKLVSWVIWYCWRGGDSHCHSPNIIAANNASHEIKKNCLEDITWLKHIITSNSNIQSLGVVHTPQIHRNVEFGASNAQTPGQKISILIPTNVQAETH